MSNYRARQRAKYAENNAKRTQERCAQMMWDQKERHRREIRRIYDDAAEEFRQKHLHMEAQIEYLTRLLVDEKRLETPPIFITR